MENDTLLLATAMLCVAYPHNTLVQNVEMAMDIANLIDPPTNPTPTEPSTNQ